MTRRYTLWFHIKGVTSVLLQLAGIAGIIWVLFFREPEPKVIMPTSRLDLVPGRITEITFKGQPK